jgi:hydroxymethylbilane synthase
VVARRAAAADGIGTLRLATRGSALALAQARLVAAMLEKAEPALSVELVPVRTSGDERAGTRREGGEPAPPGPDHARGTAVGGGVPGDKSRFVKEIEEALLAGAADLAVHSAKDVPGELPDGLAILGVPARADPRDSLCGAASIDEVPHGARVGTSSLRRRAQLLAAREDLEVVELRGNVDTRLRRLEDGDFDAVVLARAGLERLGRSEGSPFPTAVMTPAPGQGCLALEARSDDERATRLAAAITDRQALVELTAERAVTATLGADCRTPVGARAALTEVDGLHLRIETFVGTPDGCAWVRDCLETDPRDPGAAGREAARRLLAAGSADLLTDAGSM